MARFGRGFPVPRRNFTVRTVAAGSFSGTVALSGSGSLSFAGTPAIPGTVATSGSGSLSFTATPNEVGAAAFSGSGTLTFAGTPAIPGTVTLSGSGTLTATGVVVFVGSATLSGSGSLVLVATPSITAAAALSGAGTLSGTGTPSAPGSVAYSGSGALSFGGVPAIPGTVALGGSGTLTGSGTPGGGGGPALSGLVMLTGSGSLTTAPTTISFSAVVDLRGEGTLVAYTAGGTMYRFEPPTHEQSMDPTGRDFLWSRVKFRVGEAVLKYKDGRFATVPVHDPDEPGLEKVYLGGHVHIIEDAEALPLIAAGYGQYLTVVTG